jgi:3'-phosphoadenosine 5'-phosphosulfate sulfotransferase (PAPS reductase)/FAD synthetase
MKPRHVSNYMQKNRWGPSHKQKFLFIGDLGCTVLWAEKEEGRQYQSVLSDSKRSTQCLRSKNILRNLNFQFVGVAAIEG